MSPLPPTHTPTHTCTHSNHCTSQGSLVDHFAQITALNFSYPLLFVGTRGGHLLSFKIEEDLTMSPSKYSSAPLSHRIAAATYCSAYRAIISIYSTRMPSSLCSSPLLPTPVPNMHVLVVLGELDSKENTSPTTAAADGCLVQIYELSSSPRPSPLASPGVCSPCASPLSSTFSNRRNSLASLAVPGTSLPKLSLVDVAKGSGSFLPLRDSD